MNPSPSRSRVGSPLVRTPLESPVMSPEALVRPKEAVPPLAGGSQGTDGGTGAALLDAVVSAFVEAAAVGGGEVVSSPAVPAFVALVRSKRLLEQEAGASDVEHAMKVAAVVVGACDTALPPAPAAPPRASAGDAHIPAKVESVLPVGSACNPIVISDREHESTDGVMVKH